MNLLVFSDNWVTLHNKKQRYEEHSFTYGFCHPASSCHESLEKRAQREAREYTSTAPLQYATMCARTAASFHINTKTYHYYCSIVGDLDNKTIFDINNC